VEEHEFFMNAMFEVCRNIDACHATSWQQISNPFWNFLKKEQPREERFQF